MKITNVALAVSLGLFLSACGGSSDSGETSTNPTRSIQGKVIDGYVKGATVGLDLNFNGKLDLGEPTTVTGDNGAYILDIKSNEDASCVDYVPTIVDVPVGAVDEDLGIVETAYSMTIAPAIFIPSDKDIRDITPLTTVLWDNIQQDLESNNLGMLSCAAIQNQSETRERISMMLKEQEYRLQRRFNVPAEELYSDFIASGNVNLAENAAKLVKGMQLSYEETRVLLQEPNVLYADVEYIQGHWNYMMENESNSKHWHRVTTTQYKDKSTTTRIERMSDDLTTVVKIFENSMKREISERGLSLIERYAVEPDGCNITIELVQAKNDGRGLRNHHHIDNIDSLSVCQNAVDENNLTNQTILAYQSNGIDDIGKVEEVGQFQYSQEQVFSYRNLITTFKVMDADELNQFNYISADFNNEETHLSTSVLRNHSTHLEDRYVWLGRDVIKGTWSKQIQYKSGLHEFYCSVNGEVWTPVNKISDCDK